jgi:transcriptional regulator with XRE-family HTH domain
MNSTFCAVLKHKLSFDPLGVRWQLGRMGIGERIARARQEKGWSQTKLGEAINQAQTTISSWERGRTEPTREDVQRVATALGVDVAQLEVQQSAGRMVEVIGKVGANPDGSVLFATGDNPRDLAPAPPGAGERVVALEVSGHSMRGVADDGALIYFEQQRTPPGYDLLGEVVVLETDMDEVLIKRLLRGSEKNRFDLESLVGPTRRDVRVRWAAEITAIIPPRQARRIILRRGEAA